MIKKVTVIISSLIILGLVACSSPEGGTESSAVSAGQASSGLSADFANAMPISGQLAAGSVALESGENAITEEQAATLLPLWQAYTGLVADGGTADAELDALVGQIERGMTDAQIAEIAALQLTTEKLQEMIEAGDIQLGRGRGNRGGGQGGDGGQQGQGAQGGGGGGGRGQGGLGGQGGGGQGGGLGNLSPEEIAARQAERIEAAGGEDAFFAQQVSGAVVRLLNVKVNGEQAGGGGGGQNPVQLANETVAAELGLSVEEFQTAAAESSIQAVIEDNCGDVAAITEKLTEVLAETGAGQNGNLDGFMENYLQGTGQGRGGGGGRGQGGGDGG